MLAIEPGLDQVEHGIAFESNSFRQQTKNKTNPCHFVHNGETGVGPTLEAACPQGFAAFVLRFQNTKRANVTIIVTFTFSVANCDCYSAGGRGKRSLLQIQSARLWKPLTRKRLRLLAFCSTVINGPLGTSLVTLVSRRMRRARPFNSGT